MLSCLMSLNGSAGALLKARWAMKLIPVWIKCYTVIAAHSSVDDCDFDWAMQWRWRLHPTPNRVVYAARQLGHQKPVYLHREILQRLLGKQLIRTEQTDHRDRDGLNNQRY